MKRLIPFAVLLTASLFFFVACENTNDSTSGEETPDLVGAWKFIPPGNRPSDLKYTVLKENGVYYNLYENDINFHRRYSGYYQLAGDVLEMSGVVFGYEVKNQGNDLYLFSEPGDTTFYQRSPDETVGDTWVTNMRIIRRVPLPYSFIYWYNTITADDSNVYILYYVSGEIGSHILKVTTDGDSVTTFSGTQIGYAAGYGDGSLWTCHDGYVLELDPVTGDSLSRVDLVGMEGPLNPLTYDNGTVWGFVNFGRAPLLQFDLATGDTLRQVQLRGFDDLTTVDGKLYGSLGGSITLIDTDSSKVRETLDIPNESIQGLAYDGSRYYGLAYNYKYDPALQLLVMEPDGE